MIMVVMCLLVSCRKRETGTVIARVGDAVFTLEEASARIDTLRGSRSHQLYLAASSWITSELIYQEAKHKGIENTSTFDLQLHDAKRQLANQLFLDEYIYNDSSDISEEQLHEYFYAHEAEFHIHEDAIKLNIAVFNNRETATTFAANITRGKSWSESFASVRRDTTANSSLSVMPTQYYSQHTLYPPELWKAASALNLNEVSFPVKTSSGYIILQPLAFARQGKLPDYDMVHDAVHQRLMIERRRQRYEDLLGTLRKQYSVELLLGSEQPSDTVKVNVHE